MRGSFSVLTRSAEETRIVGASLAAVVFPGDVVLLSGDLGAGKTVLVQGLGAALGVRERITSPTFTIHHHYRGRYPIAHVDVYRLESFQEVLDLGLDELLGSAILIVEWGDAVAPLLPRRRLEIEIRLEDSEDRRISFRPTSPDWVGKLETVRTNAEALLGAAAPDRPTEERFGTPGPAPARDDIATVAKPGETAEEEED